MSRLRTQEGFTLPELLVTMTMAMVILLAAFALLDTSMRRTSETQLRVEATQRGRQALDVMTRQLRSQVCLNASTPAVVAATPTSVTFYADLSDGTGGPHQRVEKRSLSYDPGTRRITQSTWAPGGTAAAVTHTGAPAIKEMLANVVPDGATPIFRYFVFAPAVGAAAPTLTEVAAPDAAARGRIAKVELAFKVTAGANAPASAVSGLTLRDEVYVRAANPNDPAPYPTCA